MLVSICICTYKRKHLLDTLKSVASLNTPENFTLEIVVVDNDEHCSGKTIVEELNDNKFPYHIIYSREPKKNISAARNKCLEEASGVWIAFIDDDEVADKDWLINLYNTAIKFKADAVFGRVISTYPENTPSWIIKGGFFDRKRRNTGDLVSSGGCGCTLVNRKAIGVQRFDLDYGLTGGEDAEFFHRLHKKGSNLVYCHEAIVSEEIEKNRLNLKFLINRRIRVGSSFSKYRFVNSSIISILPYIAKNIFMLIGEVAITILSYPLSKITCYKWLLKSADRYGKLKFFYNKNIKELY